ncbi:MULTISPECIES: caspase family protein [Pseudomonas]|uniref:caspase family protein n=1 Tax=Pseudomonas TaxID=286 RepID=UPI0004B0DE1A|nr:MULTISPECIES: caspase family protein [Pseudomonas]MBF6039884.1 caspase family protein [Pseudomonas mucoides]CRL51959.1 Caspase domain protein [Pseudomonas sp. URMO17WK12:I11]
MKIKILCVHGIGHEEADESFEQSWKRSITTAVLSVAPNAVIELDYFEYDARFASSGLGAPEIAEATLRLLTSAVIHSVGDLFRRDRGIGQFPDRLRWTAGMVAQWTADEALRTTLRKDLATRINDSEPDIVCAHSLGTLVAYDTFRRDPSLMNKRVLITFGSQIANPAVRETFGGRIEGIDTAYKWYHLYNEHDHVFTAPLYLRDANFTQVMTPFDKPGDALNHDATYYLGHPETRSNVWGPLLQVGLARGFDKRLLAVDKSLGLAVPKAQTARRSRDKALLIGINNYPNPSDRLEGCVNDVFLMSSLLQESNFSPDDIRVVLDDRATTAGIRDRLHWLLDDAQAGDRRVLFYSGHGAQIPNTNAAGEADRIDECLCPWDFDWTPEHAIVDNDFRDLYIQLPYNTQFITIFDCCHSGGMTREGARRARGLTPPDDIRHRALRWEASLQMWVERDWVKEARKNAQKAEAANTVSNRDGIRRVGQAIAVRGYDDKLYNRRRIAYKHDGPFLPILMYACGESQLSYEYRHGVISYGAFTYALAQTLRSSKKRPTFNALVRATGKLLAELGYDQKPAIVGPKVLLGKVVP